MPTCWAGSGEEEYQELVAQLRLPLQGGGDPGPHGGDPVLRLHLLQPRLRLFHRAEHRLRRGLEGSLKLKEISYIHSEAYAAGELKHGTISLIEDGTLVVALASWNACLTS